LGLSFKNDTDDVRDSRAIEVILDLKEKGATVKAYDPLAIPNAKRVVSDIRYCRSAAEALEGSDACLILTEWPEFGALDEEFDLMKSRVILEGRRILSCKDAEGICW
jgi:UDPglucose 6-dehydrogenase